ncbi:MAG TPA: DUF4199 domain-containing protein [Pyrinomonadaceae bacterium]|nr:DUF4199 domain-containing protein [Pyrinomonadaceae bacterium]
MRKVVLTFGLIAGGIIGVLGWVLMWSCERNAVNLDYAMFVGYASMLIALTMVFFGVKSYRDNYAGGQITFWKGVQIGMLITLIGALFYYFGAMSYALAHPGFDERITQKFTDHIVGKLQASGAPQAEINEALANADSMRAMLQNPLTFFLMCLLEFLPVGAIVTVISALLLRRRELLPAAAP